MITSLSTVSTLPASTAAPQSTVANPPKALPDPTANAAPKDDKAAAQKQSDVRMTIEENKDAPGFIYKLVDSVTGATLAEIPRETDATLTSNGYAAGKVISTTA